ncbi:MAG: putative RNA uridine N3 methyltransferase, partial [Candidatus Geothermarchaeales archaeon]
GSRVTVEITDIRRSDLFGRIIDGRQLSEYWGYDVHSPTSGLKELLQGFQGSLRILTSKFGDDVPSVWDKLLIALKACDSIVVAFGGPQRGVHEIIGLERGKSPRLGEFILNTVPGQNTETVRTEEAVSISLGLLNLLRYKRKGRVDLQTS